MHKGMAANYYHQYAVSFTTFRAHFGEHLEYYALHRLKDSVEGLGIN